MEIDRIGKFLEKVMCRLYGISFGDEEYIDGGFKISGGVVIELVKDYDIEVEFSVDIIDSKHIVFRKNSDLCWYSLVSKEVNRVYLAYILEYSDII